jgi:hypothetical protein
VAVALVVLFGQAAAWVHAAATPHVTCLEHGDSVHLPVARVAGPAEATAGVTVGTATDEAAAHDHEHCGVQAQRGTTTAVFERAATVAIFASPPAPVSAVLVPARQLLRLAPKTSPPRAPVA